MGRLGPDSLVTVNRLPPGGFHRRLTYFMGSPSCARALNAVLSSSYESGERGLFQDWLVGEYFAHVDENEPHLSFFFDSSRCCFSLGSAMTPKVTVTLKQNGVIRRTEGRGST